MTTRGIDRGHNLHRAPSRAGAERDSYLASPGWSPRDRRAVAWSGVEENDQALITTANPPFPRLQLMQAATDVLAVLFFFLLALMFGLAVTAAIFVLLFVGI